MNEALSTIADTLDNRDNIADLPSDPFKLSDDWMMPSYFLQAHDWETLLFRPEATLQKDGTVLHCDECLCESSLLTEEKACICNIYDEECFENQL